MSDEKTEPTVEWSEQVSEAAAGDPKMAEALREFGAVVRQAMAGVKSGQYKSFDDAMFSLTGNRPELLDEDDLPEGLK